MLGVYDMAQHKLRTGVIAGLIANGLVFAIVAYSALLFNFYPDGTELCGVSLTKAFVERSSWDKPAVNLHSIWAPKWAQGRKIVILLVCLSTPL